jgi:hypothetical protein
MQFGAMCLETWGGTQLYVAFSTLNFHFCVFDGTQHQMLLFCVRHCPLWLVSSLFSWLEDEACRPWLAFKTLKWVIVRMWGGSVCHDPLGLPVNLWTTGTVV